jgi:hypothetical protein
MLKLIKLCCFVGLFILCGAGTSPAAEAIHNQVLLEEIKALRSKVTEMGAMEKRLAELETIVAAQQAQSATAATKPTATTTLDEKSRPMIKEAVEEVFEEKHPIHVGGALRVNYGYQDWNERKDDTYGDAAFELFRLNIDGEIKDWIVSAGYRFYPGYDFHTIHHGYVGYNVSDKWQVQAGVHQVPFGLQPFASHNFWFSGAYYVGLEDDYDMGIKGLYNDGPLNLTLAFYKNGELGNASDTERYSTDVIFNVANDDSDFDFDNNDGAQVDGNEETNQVNARLAYTIDHGDLGNTEFGVSGEWGQLYNNITRDTGDHWATGLHMNGNYGNWNVQLEYVSYEYAPENPESVEYPKDSGKFISIDDDIITMGCFGGSWGVPAEAEIGIVNVAYTIPMNLTWLDSITLYSDNTFIDSAAGNQPNSWQNVVGASLASGPIYTNIDVISAENMIFSGGNMVDKTVDNNDERTTRFNLNVGYYW